eukprot:366416-Chlamydomonas_euryale.AAC.2
MRKHPRGACLVFMGLRAMPTPGRLRTDSGYATEVCCCCYAEHGCRMYSLHQSACQRRSLDPTRRASSHVAVDILGECLDLRA